MCKRLTGLAVALFLSLPAVRPRDVAKKAVESAPEQSKPPQAKPQFFGGAVVEIDARHVKVSRMLVGRPIETRIFLIDADTKINTAAVKVKARVTVRYRRSAQGDTALEIELRPAAHASKPQ